MSNHFKDDLIFIEKYNADKVISIIYYDGGKKLFYVKRFKAELVSKPTMLFNNTKDSYLENLSTLKKPIAKLSFKKEVGKEREHASIDLSDFIAVKGQNAKGKIISKKKIIDIEIFDFNDNNNKSASDNINDNSTLNDANNHQITLDL